MADLTDRACPSRRGFFDQEGVDVAAYQYCCPVDGLTEVNLPMGRAPGRTPCPSCGEAARRVFTTPMVRRGDQQARRLIDSTKATSDRPEVVTAIPPAVARRSSHRSAPPNPLLQKLPRP